MIDPVVKVAIYTRQSVLDDKQFGSLGAQREAVEAYVASQPGWRALPDRYDDGGCSGANAERPALKQLLEDVGSGAVDAVAVYKLDRLSRSLKDFVAMADFFQSHGVRFVSTTQAFDTSTSVGRMTVNLLATFATFEREMIAERTRDKIAASRRRGLWTGGLVPLGYDLVDKGLVVNEAEAKRVRDIFELYLTLRSTRAVAAELTERGWTTKSRVQKNERLRPGRAFTKKIVGTLITNPLYVGQVKLYRELHPGAHESIVTPEVWTRVQALLESNGRNARHHQSQKTRGDALLSGLLRCGQCGDSMTTHTARKGTRKYHSYVCSTYLKRGAKACPGSRVPTEKLEAVLLEQIRALRRDPTVVSQATSAARHTLESRRSELDEQLAGPDKVRKCLEFQKRNLTDAVAQGGGAAAVLEKLREVESDLAEVTEKITKARSELSALAEQVIDEKDLTRALGAFGSVWSELFPRERKRIVGLLIATIVFSGREGELEITFQPDGVRTLSEESETKETT